MLLQFHGRVAKEIRRKVLKKEIVKRLNNNGKVPSSEIDLNDDSRTDLSRLGFFEVTRHKNQTGTTFAFKGRP